METILILCTYQSFIFTLFLLIFSSADEKSRKILGFFFLFLLFHHGTSLIFVVNQSLYVYAEVITFPSVFMLYPLFDAYVRSLVGRSFGRKKQLFHFIAPLLFMLIYTPFYLSMSQPDKEVYFQMSYLDILLKGVSKYPAAIIASVGLFLILPAQIILYSIDCFKLLLDHRRHLKNNFSSLQSKTLTWLLVLLVIFCFVGACGIFMIGMGTKYAEEIFYISSLISFATIGLFGTRQPRIYSEEPEVFPLIDNVPKKQNDFPSVEKSSVSEIAPQETLKEQIVKYFNEYRPFIDPDLGINQVARALKTNKTYLSRVINDGFGMNFYTFINKYRIDEAKKSLQKPENEKFSIDGIAKESGFRSLSAFYAAFKMSEGITPAAFRRKAK